MLQIGDVNSHLQQCIPTLLFGSVLLLTLLLLALAFLPLLLLTTLARAVSFLISAEPAPFGGLLLLLLCLKPCARRARVNLSLVLDHVLSFLSLHLHLSQLTLLSLILQIGCKFWGLYFGPKP